jgi:hypothetical protein
MTISFNGTELKIDAISIRDKENIDSIWLSPYTHTEDGNQAQPCEPDDAQFWRVLKKDLRGRVSVVADLFVYWTELDKGRFDSSLSSSLNISRMKRISRKAKAIADAHIKARVDGNFDDPKVTTKQEMIDDILDGKTFSGLLDEIEMRFTSITSIILSRKLFHQSNNYKAGVYKGFKILLDK